MALWQLRANIHNEVSREDFEGRLSLSRSRPLADSPPPGLDINVVFTTTEHTPAALAAAARFGRDLDARIRFLVIQAVPLHFSSLNHPPVSLEFVQQRACRMALACAEDIEITIHVYLCSDGTQCVLRVLKPRSLVILGGRKRWCRTREEQLASVLKSHGHRVVLIDGRKRRQSQVIAEQLPEFRIQGSRRS